MRRSGKKKGAKAPIHLVSAFAARQRLVLGHVKADEKSNETVAIPKFLDLLVIEGAIVAIGAMACQRDIAAKIIDKKADCVVARKGNQASLCEDVELFVAERSPDSPDFGQNHRLERLTCGLFRLMRLAFSVSSIETFVYGLSNGSPNET